MTPQPLSLPRTPVTPGTPSMSSAGVTPTATPNLRTFQPVKYLSYEDTIGVANPNFTQKMPLREFSRSASAALYKDRFDIEIFIYFTIKIFTINYLI